MHASCSQVSLHNSSDSSMQFIALAFRDIQSDLTLSLSTSALAIVNCVIRSKVNLTAGSLTSAPAVKVAIILELVQSSLSQDVLVEPSFELVPICADEFFFLRSASASRRRLWHRAIQDQRSRHTRMEDAI